MSAADKLAIFFTGATGYIGASVLQRLLNHPDHEKFEVTALVRNSEKAKKLEGSFGVKTVLGSLQDLDKLSELAENAHIVIQVANCDNTEAMKAILSGLKRRHEKTGDVPLLIHTSGTGEITDEARGDYVSETIYSDLDIPLIESLPPTAIHRPVDLLVIAADDEGYVRSHIIAPAVVYGVASGPLFDEGIPANQHTVITQMLVRSALDRGSMGVLGKGISRWGDVHIDDTADLHILLLDALLSTPEKVSHGRNGWFFAANGEHSMRELHEAVAEALFSLGRIKNKELIPYTKEDLDKYFWGDVRTFSIPRSSVDYVGGLLFSNSRCKAERGRLELGWAPTHTTGDFLKLVKPEVEMLVRKEDAKKGT
ncbi:NAD-P-binding protein [Trametes cingulata]|nr:NAD-P-binding protein [Trametes cingulata]